MSIFANAKAEADRCDPATISENSASEAKRAAGLAADQATVRMFERSMFTGGIMTMPDGQTIRHWGFEDPIGKSPKRAFPSPIIRVNQGEKLNVKLNLQAPLTKHTARVEANGGSAGSVSVARTESCLYSWHAQKPGVWFYQSHTGTPHDFEMGLYGLLVIDPPPGADGRPVLFEGGPSYDLEHILVLDDIDPTWHADAGKRMASDGARERRAFDPKYFLINGVANTEAANHRDVMARVKRGEKLLLRLCNASFSLLRVSLGGLQANIVAVDGSPLGTRERPWTSCIPVRPQQPVFMSTAARLDILIDFDPSMNDCAQDSMCPLDFEFLDLATRTVRNANASCSLHVGRAPASIFVE